MICNLAYKILGYISIISHNLSGYDAHLFIRELGKKFDTGKIGVIAANKGKYVNFTINVVVDTCEDASGKVKEKKLQLRFIDSVRFTASSLDSLMSNLVGMNGIVCDNCGGSCEFTHANEDYITHGKCRNYYLGYSKRQRNILNPI